MTYNRKVLLIKRKVLLLLNWVCWYKEGFEVLDSIYIRKRLMLPKILACLKYEFKNSNAQLLQ